MGERERKDPQVHPAVGKCVAEIELQVSLKIDGESKSLFCRADRETETERGGGFDRGDLSRGDELCQSGAGGGKRRDPGVKLR